MKKYDSIEQFRQVVRAVKTQHDFQGKNDDGSPIYQHVSDYPILTFHGTVKAHGTNAAIVKYKDGLIQFQSRERVLTSEADNAGFLATYISEDLNFLFEPFACEEYIAIYGEWCGGNIQKNVAISKLPKMFIIFGVKVDDKWQNTSVVPTFPERRIFNIEQFKTWDFNIDFNNPELLQNKIIEATIEVEENCPIGKHFNVDGIGEGIVFTCVENPDLKFKSKGKKHSTSKVKVLNHVDVEQVEGIKEFVEYSVTENRLQQGLSYLKENGFELTPKSTGNFIKWIANDILKEESDTIIQNNIDFKKAGGFIATKAKAWFFNNV